MHSLDENRKHLAIWINQLDDRLLRWLFGGLIASTIGVLALDYTQLVHEASLPTASRELPPSLSPEVTPTSDPSAPRHLGAQIREPMSFELRADGRLTATGTITPGTADRFAAEIDKRGSYVKTIVLQSPGGSVADALKMGRLIRQRSFATEVEAGKYCASSCPLVLAGGVDRRAGANASIGVHQIASAGEDGLSGSAGMKNAQNISAACQKYLREMDVDLEVWVRAMETPREKLYYFKPAEMLALKLVNRA